MDVRSVVVQGGMYDMRKTAYNHQNIEYLPEYAGMTKSEVDSKIQPLLEAMEHQNLPGERRSQSPAAAAAARKADQTATRTEGSQVPSLLNFFFDRYYYKSSLLQLVSPMVSV